MKILINALSAQRGGGQTYITNLLRFVPRDGSVELILLAPASWQPDLQDAAVRQYVLPKALDNPLVRSVWERFWLPRLLRKYNIDLLFCPGGVVNSKPPRHCSVVTMFRNMIPFDLRQRRRYPLGYQRARAWILEKIMLRSMLAADLVVFVSDFARQVIERHANGRAIRSVVIPHGIGEHFRHADAGANRRLDWLPSAGYFLYVSAFDVYKAHVEVVQAFALLKKLRKTNEKLLLVGPENIPAYGQKVRAEINRLGLAEDVIVPGPVPYADLPAMYAGATVNIFASESENCPNILLEALAAGRPVVASSYPPMPEFGGDAVIYFDHSSPQDLADKLAALLGNAEKMADLGGRAKARSLLYDWETSARSTWQAMRDLKTGRLTT